MAFVLDASCTIALALAENLLPDPAGLAERLARDGAIVPALWRFEVANGLLAAARRKRIGRDQALSILGDLEGLPISVDQAATKRAWGATFGLAEKHGLTVHDAAYLELAVRTLLPLASLDGALIAAARKEAVPMIGL